ncbi:hypothetical protein Ddc_07439 [Ditylenchus destructor]|nr:hypothetical protein Ddc_07439 [Ditylenchus destructor]
MGCRMSRTTSQPDLTSSSAQPSNPNSLTVQKPFTKRSSISSTGSADLPPAACCSNHSHNEIGNDCGQNAEVVNITSSGKLGNGYPRSPTSKGEDRRISNGQSILHRRDTPASGIVVPPPTMLNGDGVNHQNGTDLNNDTLKSLSITNGYSIVTNASCVKPLSQIESASQADFFRMLDEKIAQGAKQLSLDSDLDE